MKTNEQKFAELTTYMADVAHSAAKEKGFYGAYDAVKFAASTCGLSPEKLTVQLDQACLARVMSEVGEAVEALRHGNPPAEKIKGHTHEEEELADTFIRLLDYCGFKGYDIGAAIIKKMVYNEGRAYLHGKNS